MDQIHRPSAAYRQPQKPKRTAWGSKALLGIEKQERNSVTRA
jgi:hypothetical protein